ncbi:MAG: CRISPR-associated endonuclease Cas1 [Cyanobacteria bacterium SBLK]|nr:CRISPR-associated endonuclease Cas1 [Cyanobacteria bacterium SBLK]
MNVLYLVEPGSHLEADRRDFAIIISTSLNNPQNDAIAHRQPIRETQQIVIFAGCTVGRTASRAIDRYRIPFSFIGDKGSITAHNHLHETPVYAPLQQERNRDREFCLAFAQSLLRGRWMPRRPNFPLAW